MALFKIYENIDSKNELPSTYNKGYMYFDATKNLFYIDTVGTGGSTGTRVALNAWGAQKAYGDENNLRISTNYLRKNEAAQQVAHKLTIGTYQFDGSADITIPLYDGLYNESRPDDNPSGGGNNDDIQLFQTSNNEDFILSNGDLLYTLADGSEG